MIWDIDPQVFSFSPVPRWYGLIFAGAFLTSFYLIQYQYRHDKKPVEWCDSLLVSNMIGMVIGMRLGHCLFYQPEIYLSEPWRILMIWEGGYASHGGYVGIFGSILYHSRKFKLGFWWVADRVTLGALWVSAWIRVGNFFNSEMIGRPSDEPWAIIFPSLDMVPRHPTQLYEAFGYFVCSFLAWYMWRYTSLVKSEGKITGIILILGFSWRIFTEHFKINQVAFEESMLLNMGQWLSIPFIVLGGLMVLGVQNSFKKLPKS